MSQRSSVTRKTWRVTQPCSVFVMGEHTKKLFWCKWNAQCTEWTAYIFSSIPALYFKFGVRGLNVEVGLENTLELGVKRLNLKHESPDCVVERPHFGKSKYWKRLHVGEVSRVNSLMSIYYQHSAKWIVCIDYTSPSTFLHLGRCGWGLGDGRALGPVHGVSKSDFSN